MSNSGFKPYKFDKHLTTQMGNIIELCTKRKDNCIFWQRQKKSKKKGWFAKVPEGDAFLRGEPIQYINIEDTYQQI